MGLTKTDDTAGSYLSVSVTGGETIILFVEHYSRSYCTGIFCVVLLRVVQPSSLSAASKMKLLQNIFSTFCNQMFTFRGMAPSYYSLCFRTKGTRS
jgi:hypothetical protein